LHFFPNARNDFRSQNNVSVKRFSSKIKKSVFQTDFFGQIRRDSRRYGKVFRPGEQDEFFDLYFHVAGRVIVIDGVRGSANYFPLNGYYAFVAEFFDFPKDFAV
jgi:hypothetical protein